MVKENKIFNMRTVRLLSFNSLWNEFLPNKIMTKISLRANAIRVNAHISDDEGRSN